MSGSSLCGTEPLVLSDVPLRIDPVDVLRFQGYKPGVDRPGELSISP